MRGQVLGLGVKSLALALEAKSLALALEAKSLALALEVKAKLALALEFVALTPSLVICINCCFTLLILYCIMVYATTNF